MEYVIEERMPLWSMHYKVVILN